MTRTGRRAAAGQARLRDLGARVAALAHELHQPLTAMVTYVSAGHRLAEAVVDPNLKQALSRALDQGQRLSEIAKQLHFLAGRIEAEALTRGQPSASEGSMDEGVDAVDKDIVK